MLAPPRPPSSSLPPELKLPVSLLTRYVFFLTRRPISSSNSHYLGWRLEGLRSLGGLLAGSGEPVLQEAARQLLAMNPANFYRLAEQLQETLLPVGAAITEMPRDFVVSNSPPRSDFLAGARRLLLLVGPAIGIGDELILFPLPGWIKAAHPDLEVTVMSAYRGLWDRVEAVDHRVAYTAHADLLHGIRGDGPVGRYDVVVLADFERPDLYPAVCGERPAGCYVELSIGGRSGVLVDAQRGWLHRARGPLPYMSNYYFGMHHVARWLGLEPQAGSTASVVRRTAFPRPDRLRVYVNAFTSKYDPSAVYWSRLLSSLFPRPPDRPVEVVVDPGTNAQTQGFAHAVARSAGARLPAGVTLSVARPSDGASMSFEDVFAQMEQAQVVLCTDSFAAHAAPIFGCSTLVIAALGLENWRVPFRPAYYFSPEADVDVVAAGMRQVLGWFTSDGASADREAPVSEAERELDRWTLALQDLFERDGRGADAFDPVTDAYRHFAGAYRAVADRLPDWPPEFEALIADADYLESLDGPGEGAGVPAALRADLALHLRDRWQWWQSTNLRKYLRMTLDASGPTAPRGPGQRPLSAPGVQA